jgi:hypothetical protein
MRTISLALTLAILLSSNFPMRANAQDPKKALEKGTASSAPENPPSGARSDNSIGVLRGDLNKLQENIESSIKGLNSSKSDSNGRTSLVPEKLNRELDAFISELDQMTSSLGPTSKLRSALQQIEKFANDRIAETSKDERMTQVQKDSIKKKWDEQKLKAADGLRKLTEINQEFLKLKPMITSQKPYLAELMLLEDVAKATAEVDDLIKQLELFKEKIKDLINKLPSS